MIFPSKTIKNSIFIFSIAVAVVGIIGWADYVTGWELGFLVFYFIPIILVAWYVDKRTAVVIAFISATIWALADHFLESRYSSPFYAFWNSAIGFIAFVLIAVLTATIRRSLDHEKKISADLQHSLDQVKQLKGMLPICASCKKIRNDKGYWEQIEHYISERSETEFTHGLCPECAVKLYPELIDLQRAIKKG